MITRRPSTMDGTEQTNWKFGELIGLVDVMILAPFYLPSHRKTVVKFGILLPNFKTLLINRYREEMIKVIKLKKYYKQFKGDRIHGATLSD